MEENYMIYGNDPYSVADIVYGEREDLQRLIKKREEDLQRWLKEREELQVKKMEAERVKITTLKTTIERLTKERDLIEKTDDKRVTNDEECKLCMCREIDAVYSCGHTAC